MKSADWKQNKPFALKAWTAADLAQLPRYYVMISIREWPRPWLLKCPPAQRSRRASGFLKRTCAFIALNTAERGSKVVYKGIGRGGPKRTRQSF
jgi:hypothetical protein